MTRTLAVIAAIVLGLVLVSAGLAVAAGASGGGAIDRAAALVGRDDDASEGADRDDVLQGVAAQRAARAALRATGGGTVRGVERGDDGAAYDVEVRKPDGSVVEVQLDASFNVIRASANED